MSGSFHRGLVYLLASLVSKPRVRVSAQSLVHNRGIVRTYHEHRSLVIDFYTSRLFADRGPIIDDSIDGNDLYLARVIEKLYFGPDAFLEHFHERGGYVFFSVLHLVE